jgi:hypothetical protein
MKDAESEQSQGDLDIEVTDIDEPGAAIPVSESAHAVLRPRFSPRQRRLQLIITGGIVVLALLIILVSAAPVRELVGGVFIRPAPSPTPTLVPGVDLFYVQGSPSWGQLSIDGHLLAHLPIIQSEPPLRLSRGQHVLAWQAEPFLTQSCTVSVPPRYADSCPLRKTVELGADLFAWVIRFAVALDLLTASQRIALVQVAQAALDAQHLTDTVRPGELYALSPQNPACKAAPGEPMCYAVAKQPLKAILSWQLDTDTALGEPCASPEPGSGCIIQGQNCHLFCTGSTAVSSAGREWDVAAPVRVMWAFATFDGRVLEHEVPDNSLSADATGAAVDEALMPLRFTWDGLAWHAAPDIDAHSSGYSNPVCTAAQVEVQSLEPPADASGEPVYLQWQFASSSVPAAGCLAEGTPQSPAGMTPTPTHAPPFLATCLHRFGVLLTVNDAAQRAWGLPRADAYEQGLARQLATGRGAS